MENNIKHQNITLLKHSLVKNDDRSLGAKISFDDAIAYKLKENVDKMWLPTFQGTDAGFRVAKYDENYFNYWNGWIFVDIDHTDDESEKMIQMLHEKLCKYSFYKGSQLSTSGHGIHIFFYMPSIFNLAEEYYADAVMCYNLVFSFIDKKYFDEHNFQHSQLFKMSKHKWLVNDNFDAADTAMMFDSVRRIEDYWEKVVGMFPESVPNLELKAKHEVKSFYGIDEECKVNGVTKKTETEFTYEIVNDDFKYVNGKKDKFHISHSGRYALYCTLMAIYECDKEKVKNALRYIMKYQKGKHSYDFYVDEHDGTKNIDFKISQYTLNWLKNNFGFDFIQKERINEINLGENDWIGKHKDELLGYLKPGINMLIAGTGTGKTEIWKQLNDEICEDMLAVNELPILVVEPYNSIIDSKYNKGEVNKVVGATKFPKEWTGNAMYVTNYSHVISGINEGEFRRFKYIVIDESHLLTKEKFRCETLLRFIDAVKLAAKESIVVLQTGTPMDEEMLFDNINKIKVNKKESRHIEYCYKTTKNIDKFDIVHISKLVNEFVLEGRKVYIYWNNISLIKCNKFKELNKDLRVAIYHKKNKDSDDKVSPEMKRINEMHMLGNEFDVIISSVYFGVGNDLNDEGKTACIIIGNNAWQEDIQVIGRWRKSNDIKVVSVFNNDQCINYSKDGYDDLLRYKMKNLKYNFYDKTNRSKSIIINKQTYQIEREEWIRPLAMMSICELFNSVIDYKNIKLREYGIEVDDKFEELDADLDRINEIKEFNRKIKAIRDDCKREFIDTLVKKGRKDIKYSNDTKIEGWERAVVSLYDNCKEMFDKLIVNGYITKFYHTDSIKLFVRIIKNVEKEQIDAAELHAFKYFREMMIDKDAAAIWKNNMKYSELYGAAAYVMFVHYKNKADNDYAIKADYFYKFYYNCLDYNGFDEEMIEYLNNHWKEKTATDEFFGIKDKMDPGKTYEMIERSIVFNKSSEKRSMEKILARLNNKHLNAGRNKKKFVFEGKEYANVDECARELNVTRKTIYQRLRKQKIN